MSKWTEVRDTIVNALDVNSITEEVKEQLTQNIIAELFPAIEAAADKFTATSRNRQLMKQAGTKSVTALYCLASLTAQFTWLNMCSIKQ